MICGRCSGKVMIDWTFSDNASFEISCIHCGDRKFIGKDTEVGQWLAKAKLSMERQQNGLI